MDTAYQSLLLVHGLCGLVALVTFWVAAFAKKGAPLHLRAGKTYMVAMLGIVITAGQLYELTRAEADVAQVIRVTTNATLQVAQYRNP